MNLPNLAEEIESMGRAEKRELTNRLAVLLAHLLKWAGQSGRRSTEFLAACPWTLEQLRDAEFLPEPFSSH